MYDRNRVEQMPGIENVALARVYAGERLVGLVPNLPGKQGSLRIFHGLTKDGKLNHEGVAEALDIFGRELVDETIANPSSHPNIDLLLTYGEGLNIDFVTTRKPNLFEELSANPGYEARMEGVELLEKGLIRTAEKVNGVWNAQKYGIDAMNKTFGAQDNYTMGDGFYDKVPLLTAGWTKKEFDEAGVRFIPGSFARRGAYIGKGTTLMPGGIVNTGAYIAGEGVMIDGGARVATGVQIGKGVKLGAGSGTEGMLEPAGMLPTILEDKVRVGANCELTGLIGEGSIISSGVVMASGVKIYDERTADFLAPIGVEIEGKLHAMPHIPADRVAVPGIYVKDGSPVGGTCIRLLEKPASETDFAKAPKNTQLYTTF